MEIEMKSLRFADLSLVVKMALAPAFILLVYYFIDPVNTERLFTTVPGQIIVAIAVVLDVLAYLWARKILNPDI